MLLIILIVLIVLALGGGVYAGPTHGPWSWSPLGLIVAVLVVLFLLGRL